MIPCKITIKMTRCMFFIVLIVMFIIAGCEEKKTSYNEQQKEFEQSLSPRAIPSFKEVPMWTIEERMKHHKVPGLSIAVFQNGELSWSRAYGVADMKTGRPLTVETNFQAASISKAITAFAAMKLVEDNIIHLDKPVNSMLNSWQIDDNDLSNETPVTLRHLLSHMGGLNVSGFSGYKEGEKIPTLTQILNGAVPAKNKKVAVIEQPGQRIKYSGGGTLVAQAIMTDQTGEDYARIIQRTIFDPVGMDKSHVKQPLPIEMRSQSARGHAGLSSDPVEGFSHIYPERAAGGVWSNPSDLATLAIAFTDALGGKKNGFISPLTAKEMILPQFNNSGSIGAFIWDMPDGKMFGHTGGNAGYRNNFYGFVDGRGGAVIMTNADNGFSLIWEVMAALAKTYGWSYGATELREATPISSELAETLVGTYQTELSWVGDLQISIDKRGDQLWLTAPPILSATTLYYEKGDTFFLDTGSRLFIDYNKRGEVVGFDAELEEGIYAKRISEPIN